MKKFKAQLNAYWHRVKWNMYLYENELVMVAIFGLAVAFTYVIVTHK